MRSSGEVRRLTSRSIVTRFSHKQARTPFLTFCLSKIRIEYHLLQSNGSDNLRTTINTISISRKTAVLRPPSPIPQPLPPQRSRRWSSGWFVGEKSSKLSEKKDKKVWRLDLAPEPIVKPRNYAFHAWLWRPKERWTSPNPATENNKSALLFTYRQHRETWQK